MNRRQFTNLAVVAAANAALTGVISAQSTASPDNKPSSSDADRSMEAAMRGPRQQIAMLVYPQFTALDLIGPHTFLAALMNVDVHLVWKDKQPVAIDRGGTAIVPTSTFQDCPQNLDLLFVPGGLEGTVVVMKDEAVLDFLADRGSRAKYVTSVCTGSLVLGCAGLLKGYRATCHWAARDILPLFGAIPVEQRVVEDRNRITGAGVTSGIDFGLAVAARMRDPTYAEMLQLVNEYDPQPPFHAGTPAQAGAGLTAHLRNLLAPGIEAARNAAASTKKARGVA